MGTPASTEEAQCGLGSLVACFVGPEGRWMQGTVGFPLSRTPAGEGEGEGSDRNPLYFVNIPAHLDRSMSARCANGLGEAVR